MKVADFKNINYDKDDETGIVTVTINRPEIKNALAVMVLYELYWAVDAIETDPKAKAMILTGAKSPEDEDPANEAFSSGGYFNLADLEALDEETKSQIDLTGYRPEEIVFEIVATGQTRDRRHQWAGHWRRLYHSTCLCRSHLHIRARLGQAAFHQPGPYTRTCIQLPAAQAGGISTGQGDLFFR